MQFSYPPVCRLPVHLEDEQTVRFDATGEQTELAKMLERVQGQNTQLMGWFKYSAASHGPNRQLLYHDFPSHLMWNQKLRAWQLRRKPSDTIGRMYIGSPSMYFMTHW